MRVWLPLLALVLLTVPADAQPYDFVAEGSNLVCGVGIPRPDPALEWVPGDVQRTPEFATIAPAGSGRVLGALEGSRVQLAFIEPDGTRTPFFTGANGYRARMMVVNREGAVYVLATQGFVSPYFLIEISAEGTLQGIEPFPFTPESVDLAGDQCTLFAVTAGAIRRYDVCTSTVLPDFTALSPSQSGTVKILPNGDVLLGDNQFPDHELLRYNPAGVLVRTYTISQLGQSFSAIGLSRDGGAVLVGDRCGLRVLEFDLTSGAVIRQVATEFVNSFDTIVSSRGFAAALGPLASADIPSTSTIGLISLLALLTVVALRRLT